MQHPWRKHFPPSDTTCAIQHDIKDAIEACENASQIDFRGPVPKELFALLQHLKDSKAVIIKILEQRIEASQKSLPRPRDATPGRSYELSNKLVAWREEFQKEIISPIRDLGFHRGARMLDLRKPGYYIGPREFEGHVFAEMSRKYGTMLEDLCTTWTDFLDGKDVSEGTSSNHTHDEASVWGGGDLNKMLDYVKKQMSNSWTECIVGGGSVFVNVLDSSVTRKDVPKDTYIKYLSERDASPAKLSQVLLSKQSWSSGRILPPPLQVQRSMSISPAPTHTDQQPVLGRLSSLGKSSVISSSQGGTLLGRMSPHRSSLGSFSLLQRPPSASSTASQNSEATVPDNGEGSSRNVPGVKSRSRLGDEADHESNMETYAQQIYARGMYPTVERAREFLKQEEARRLPYTSWGFS